VFIAKELASSLNISSYMFVTIAMKERMTNENYTCHRCGECMEERTAGSHRWHICDKCMGYEETKPLYTQ
jgi:formylmethanofuran dehydrogenase subunit E